jgi:hypothetical protein
MQYLLEIRPEGVPLSDDQRNVMFTVGAFERVLRDKARFIQGQIELLNTLRQDLVGAVDSFLGLYAGLREARGSYKEAAKLELTLQQIVALDHHYAQNRANLPEHTRTSFLEAALSAMRTDATVVRSTAFNNVIGQHFQDPEGAAAAVDEHIARLFRERGLRVEPVHGGGPQAPAAQQPAGGGGIAAILGLGQDPVAHHGFAPPAGGNPMDFEGADP